MFSISNKEALKNKIHEIHNYLRNNGAGYGMNALKVFNIIYGLKKIEETGMIDKVKLRRPYGEFSYILNLANQNKDEQLAASIFGDVLQAICDSDIKYLLFYEIPQNIRGTVFSYLIKEIDKITAIEKSCNVLLSGKIYEYFIGRDESAISELGAYFTDRHIVNYILTKLDPIRKADGSIPTMVDMFGGSGGFTTGYIEFMKNKYQDIDWHREVNKIYHFDINEDVIKMAGLEFLCLTGVLPNMENLKYKNSFTDEFNGRKYFYPITNPPYGGDKNSTSDAKTKRDKLRQEIKRQMETVADESILKKRQDQLKRLDLEDKQEREETDKYKVSVSSCSGRIQKYAKQYKLDGKDKESASLMLLMDILETDGTAIGVLKEGVFFDKKYKKLRQNLLTNFNVREVISIPDKAFENTTTKTSILIFDNTSTKTTHVKFTNLLIQRHEQDTFQDDGNEIILTENQGDIYNVADELVSNASIIDISNTPTFSLNGKDYKSKTTPVADGYTELALGSISTFNSKVPKTHTGPYRLVKIKDIDNERIIHFDEIEAEKVKEDNICMSNDILISTVRPKSRKSMILTPATEENLSDICFTLSTIRVNPAKCDPMYVYAVLYPFLDTFEKELCTGSSYPTFNIKALKDFKIPVPTDPAKMQAWTNKITIEYNRKHAAIRELYQLEQQLEQTIRTVQEYTEHTFDQLLKHNKKENKYKAKDGQEDGIYRFYTSSQDNFLYRDDYEFEDQHILIGRGGNGCIHLAKQFAVSHDDVFVLSTTDAKYDLKYIYYYLKANMHLLRDAFNGTGIKHISKSTMGTIKIRLPTSTTVMAEIQQLFTKSETLKQTAIEAEITYRAYFKDLHKEIYSRE